MVKSVMSLKRIVPSAPLITSRHVFAEESTEHFTTGRTYTVIKSGYHWIKECGFGIWMTTDENPETTDEDFGVFISVDDFKKQFFTP